MRCSAQRRQDIIANRTRKSARARREICWQRRPKQNCGSCRVKRLKKKKKSAWTICWGLNWHTQQEFSHQNNKGGLGSGSVSSRGTRASPLPLKRWLFSLFFVFLFRCPLVGFLRNTDGSRWWKAARCLRAASFLLSEEGQRCPHQSGTLQHSRSLCYSVNGPQRRRSKKKKKD